MYVHTLRPTPTPTSPISQKATLRPRLAFALGRSRSVGFWQGGWGEVVSALNVLKFLSKQTFWLNFEVQKKRKFHFEICSIFNIPRQFVGQHLAAKPAIKEDPTSCRDHTPRNIAGLWRRRRARNA